jgi:hypothetical protein
MVAWQEHTFLERNKHMNRILFALLSVASLSAFAGETGAAGPGIALKPTLASLSCPTGSQAQTDGAGLFCGKAGAGAAQRLTGPYIGLHKNGTKESEGVYANGERTGRWVFFNDQGLKTREIEFKNDRYDGKFVDFHADGQVKLELTYVAGKRHGVQKEFDAAGKLVAQTTFVNDLQAK